MKVFVDNDIILDILLVRKDFSFSAKVFEYIEKGIIQGYTSPIVFTNTFFLISKAIDKESAWNALRKLKLLITITKVNESIVEKALASGFKDFEDAIQYYSALTSKIKYLVTRNKSDYLGEEIIIVSPQELLAIVEKN